MLTFMPKIVFFPHSNKEFRDEYHLRDWLNVDLRIHKHGLYFLREARGLGDLEEGSVVFFHRNNQVVGSAVVDKAKRPTTEKERERRGEEYKHIVGFSPSSIWAFGDYEFVRISEAEKVVKKKLKRGYPVIDDITKLVELYKLVVTNLI